jgi:hypothetical protein
MHEDDVIARARRARALLADPDVSAAFDDVETEIFSEWRHARDVHARESLHATERALGRVRATLQGWADELTRRGIE